MGAWSTSITGSDDALDVKDAFEDRFGASLDQRSTLGQDVKPMTIPTEEEGEEFLLRSLEEGFEPHIAKQVTAFLLMQRGAPMSEQVRALALEGIEEEDTSDWSEQDERDSVLADFRARVEAYPGAGAAVFLPNQPGLFETILASKDDSDVDAI